MLFFKVTGTPLAKARFENKTALIRHEINAHFIHAFNGTYKVAGRGFRRTIGLV